MAKSSWYLNRLRAMSFPEIRWRLEQKQIAGAERRAFGKQHMQITEAVFYQDRENLVFHEKRLPVADCFKWNKKAETDRLQYSIPLLGGYEYAVYKKDWHAGFQTENHWETVFSYDLQYKQRDDIGDARTNWELNRHFQFALLACHYAQTGQEKYLTELSELFTDWNENNPFLHGISWTSVMEVAIRDINWIYTLGFLVRTESPAAGKLCEQLRIGIINMTAYISAHYSRFSSANNHVIVEAAAMGIAGIVMDCEEWSETACFILNQEILRQNYPDGVNQEMSLHYQSFFMEAVGLLCLVMQGNAMRIPQMWRNMLTKMSRYLCDCQGDYGETVVFGDDDAGKILDLAGTERNHYQYVLQLMGLILPERYTEEITDITLRAVITADVRERFEKKPLYQTPGSICYEKGGVSILRSRDRRMLIGIDHGALGFGSIAAHGHADALSFQMYLEGRAVFADAGTYIYHTDLESRNAFRKTENHNTVTINGADQSEMLGAFLWGKRAQTRLLGHTLLVGNPVADAGENQEHFGKSEELFIEAEHDGYEPVIHKREYRLSEGALTIRDRLSNVEKMTDYQLNFLLGRDTLVCQRPSSGVPVDGMMLTVPGENGSYCMFVTVKAAGKIMPEIRVLDAWISTEYGSKQKTKKLSVKGKTGEDMEMVTVIRWEKQK